MSTTGQYGLIVLCDQVSVHLYVCMYGYVFGHVQQVE
jgi:hypothetical protein